MMGLMFQPDCIIVVYVVNLLCFGYNVIITRCDSTDLRINL